ncbi:hypothetical protein ACIRA0001_1354 [Acinetobacter radioresistens SK82]|uniref:Uncharacterized protein n=1 Tax=Acinetobacter radioresistens SK82 TaxID=596318 RepID=A0ABM9YKL7_ACIRA|nr:hypothetical protein ACIRA0001_1354 [Acinetobacter radioresistens SK82]EXB87282.1 hypothetical protein J538_0776 [Acinetobacter sp. 272263]EXE59090.1 hypothetical protein J579_0968 [Acinetobacter sp. 1239920]
MAQADNPVESMQIQETNLLAKRFSAYEHFANCIKTAYTAT